MLGERVQNTADQLAQVSSPPLCLGSGTVTAVWLVVQEGDLGIASPITPEDIPAEYTDKQMEEMQSDGEAPSTGLAQLRLRASTSGRAAVALAAADPEGVSHSDDTYVSVGGHGARLGAKRGAPQQLRARGVARVAPGRGGQLARARGQDVVVPLRQANSNMYPLINLASSSQRSAQKGFAREQVLALPLLFFTV